MATKFSIDIDTTADVAQPMVSGALRTSLTNLQHMLAQLKSGYLNATTTITARNTGVKASGTFTIDASATGDLTATINGVGITVTWAVDDATTAAALTAAINASSNALIQNLVTATRSGLVITVTAVSPGKLGNAVTTEATGTGITADQARLTGGSETRLTYSL